MTMIIDGTNGLTFNNATTQASAGQVLQVVNAQFDNATQVSTSSSTPTSSVVTASITPKFATSKILVLVNTQVTQTSGSSGAVAIYRGTSTSLGWNGWVYGSSSQNWFPTTLISQDSPATTSSTTYTMYYKSNSGSISVFWGSGASSTITLMEIAA